MLKPMSMVFALCIALSIFVGNGAIASAAGAVYTFCEDGKHLYNIHAWTGDGYFETGAHMHMLGHDKNGEEVYVACQWSIHYQYYVDKCACGAVQPGSRTLEAGDVKHSAEAR